ncbi:hypothetical protein ACFSYD_12805 [Paracoccus aerius]|nr:hypothetical protein GCM10017322_24450 [Paracoccus aerius]
MLNGGVGNDSLIGGADVDTFVFQSTAFENNWSRFNQSRNLVFTPETGGKVTNRDGDGRVVLSSGSEGLDLIQDGEVAQFQNGKQDLSAIRFVINRTSDGHATGKVFENGIEVTKLTNGIDGPAQGLHQPLDDILWDTLTPIGTGSYSGHYRSDRKLGERIELSGWTKGQGLLIHDGVERTNVQIHSGQYNGNSEGCFIVSREFRKAFFDHVRDSVEGNGDLVYKGGYFFPVVPVVVQVTGEVKQTKIQGIDDVVTRPRPGAGPAEATVGFDVMDVFGGKKLDHFRKSIDVFFTATADRKDWKLPANLVGSEPATGGSGHGRIWREDTDGGAAVYGIRIGVSGETMRSHVTFDIPIGAKSPARIDFKIVDLDLWTLSSKGWGLYSVSKEVKGKDGKVRPEKDTDGAHGAEKLLLVGLSNDQLTSSVTMKAPKLPALAAEPDDAAAFASVSTFADDFLV